MTIQILNADCRVALKSLLVESVHCCVTSPPYLGLRNYKLPPSVWGGDSACAHAWQDASWNDYRHGTVAAGNKQHSNGGSLELRIGSTREGEYCGTCGAWRGCLGLEPDHALYIEHLVDVFREIRRVLRRDGTCWLNLGDSYASNWPCSRRNVVGAGSLENGKREARPPRMGPGLKDKDLMLLPHRVAIALQEDGWWIRQDVVWAKTNPMPESVTDRPTRAHEYIFLLSRSERYFYDADAVREPSLPERTAGRNSSCVNDKIPVTRKKHMKVEPLQGNHGSMGHDGNGLRYDRTYNNPLGRNKRSVWTVATQPYPEAHFATFPETLIEPCILAGSRPGDTVLDPFGGSGTVGKVCQDLGRDALLIELNPEYCELARKRVNAARLPLLDEEAAV